MIPEDLNAPRDCPHDDAIEYSIKCLDRRVYYVGNGADESAEIYTVGRRPRTGICGQCGARVPLPEREKK